MIYEFNIKDLGFIFSVNNKTLEISLVFMLVKSTYKFDNFRLSESKYSTKCWIVVHSLNH